MTAAEHEIRELHERWIAAVNAGDLPRLLELLADDVVLMNPGGPAIDRDGFAANFRSSLEQLRFHCASEPLEIVVAGDFAFTRCRDTLKVAPLAGGAETHYAGDRLTIWRRHADGRWQLARDAHTLKPLEDA